MKKKWISVKDQQPMGDCFVFEANSGRVLPSYHSEWEASGWNVTHWMPLRVCNTCGSPMYPISPLDDPFYITWKCYGEEPHIEYHNKPLPKPPNEEEMSNNNLPTYAELAHMIHENAKEKGWWPEGVNKPYKELDCLFHSELSEAFEEYRNGMPMVYYVCKVNQDADNPQDRIADCSDSDCGPCELCDDRTNKPEGIAIELADCAIRILDYLAHCGVRPGAWERPTQYELIPDGINGIPQMISFLHGEVSDAFGNTALLYDIVRQIEQYLSEKYNLNLRELILLKHEYNKTRPYRHGGKVC